MEFGLSYKVIRLLILSSLAGEDILEGSEQPLEALPVQRKQSAIGGCLHRRGAGFVLKEGELAEEVARLVLEYGFLLLAFHFLKGLGAAFLQDVKGVAAVALLDDRFAIVPGGDFESIGHLAALIGVHGGKQRNLVEEGLVELTLLGGGILDDVVEGLAIGCQSVQASLASTEAARGQL